MNLLDLDDQATREHVTQCRACKHALKTPESRALGLGPDCASKLGLTPRRPLRITGLRWWDCDGQTDLFEDDP
ncbi:DUF6011 domain-containing protein [Nonomuraea sp. NPDC000554]|uniref:DUF6011 domain-containing protein n=1 Tax=Nonomuraea sp. NPDC000554 TaxID=3154259 RepID=UPI0033332A83